MKRLKPWQRGLLAVVVAACVIGLIAYAVWLVDGYEILSARQLEYKIENAYIEGQASVKASDEYTKELLSEREAGYNEGYDVGYSDGLEDGKSQAEETKAEPSTSSEQETSSSSNQTSSTSEQQTITVYITDYGSKYHRQGCQYLWDSSNAVTLSNAKAWGYSPCSVCDPPA